jgi:hypothetical protein
VSGSRRIRRVPLRRSLRRLAAAPLLLAIAIAGCGKKGDPQAPLRREPGRVAELIAHRVDERIELRFTVPATNHDGSRPPVIERVEIYRASTPPGEAAPSESQILQRDNLRATFTIRSEDAPAPATPPAPDARIASPGEAVTFVDGIDPAAAPGTPAAPTWRYIAVGVRGESRRGTPSPVAAVPLSTVVPAAPAPAITFDERRVTLTWTPPAEPANQIFRVYRVESAEKAAAGKLISDAALDKPEFSAAVEFGAEQCFVVRTAVKSENTTIEGPPGPAACITPVDKFPPPAPAGLTGVPDQGAITLVWNAVDAPDLGGYIVLRGDGAGETLQPLMKEPLTEATYRDTTVTSGTSYAYAVVAVDRAGNQSAPSQRELVTARFE